jgi:hypothetical protein
MNGIIKFRNLGFSKKIIKNRSIYSVWRSQKIVDGWETLSNSEKKHM